MKWRPGKVLVKEARRHQRRVAQQIRSALPPEPQRGKPSGPTGGSLGAKVRSRSLVAEKAWGAKLLWSKLGNTLSFFRRGTRRGQPARPLDLKPEREPLKRVVLKDARRHFAERDKRGQ